MELKTIKSQINHVNNFPKGLSNKSLVSQRKVITNAGMALENDKEGENMNSLELNIKTEDNIEQNDFFTEEEYQPVIQETTYYDDYVEIVPEINHNEGTIIFSVIIRNDETSVTATSIPVALESAYEFFTQLLDLCQDVSGFATDEIIAAINEDDNLTGATILESLDSLSLKEDSDKPSMQLNISPTECPKCNGEMTCEEENGKEVTYCMDCGWNDTDKIFESTKLNEDLINGVTSLAIGDRIQSDKNKDVIYKIINIFINEEGKPMLHLKNERTEKEIKIEPQGIFAKNCHKLKESKIVKEASVVKPVGMPQASDSFVNLDLDLSTVTVSDYIVRLAQAIRSEQKSILEYDALLSANGSIPGDDKPQITEIREDEKDHMVILSKLLRRQIETNFKANEDRVNTEQGEEITEDKKKKGKVSKEAQPDGSSDQDVYHIAMANEEGVLVDENGKVKKETLDMIKEAWEIAKDYFTEANELEEEKNYRQKEETDYIAWLENGDKTILKDWSIEDLKALYSWCETELNNSLAKDVVGWVIKDEIDSRGTQSQTEDINIDFSETMSQDQYEVSADVKYDEDFILKVGSNLKDAIQQFNQDMNARGIGIDSNSFKFGNGKIDLVLIKHNNSEIEINDEYIKRILTSLCKTATTYEYWVTLVE